MARAEKSAGPMDGVGAMDEGDPSPQSGTRPAFDTTLFARQNRMTREDAQRHSRRVRYMRLAVPAAAAGLMLTYAVNVAPRAIDASFLENFSNIKVETAPMTLDRPRYSGEDLDGQPFEIAATSATRVSEETSLVDLNNPEAFRTLDPDGETETIAVTAKTGRLDTQAQSIDLADNVQLRHSIGGAPMVFNTDAASLDLQQNTVTSSARVTGGGERGTVAADNVTVFQGEGRAVLTGNVKLRIEPKTKKKEDPNP